MGGEPYLVGIAGPSCSGKTALARGVARRLAPGATTLVSIDAYYRDLADLDPVDRAARNFDHPDAVDHPLLRDQLAAIASGQPVLAPVYDFSTHTRSTERRTIRPSPVVVVEGLFALYWPEIRQMLGLALFIDAPHDVCLARRLKRDVRNRGRSADLVRRQYEQAVRPMGERFVVPTREHADLVLDGTAPLEVVVETVLRKLGLPNPPFGS